MSVLIVCVVVNLVCIALAIAGMFAVRRFVHIDDLKVNHEVAAVMVSVLGTLYAVLLGLIVVDALQAHKQAESELATEANSLGMLMQLGRTLSGAQRRPIFEAELHYCDAVTEKEWPLMQRDKAPEHETIKAFGELWQATGRFVPTNSREENIHQSMLAAMTQFTDARRYRIVTSHQHIPILLWVVLVTGGISIISFTYFFGLHSLKAQAIMTAVVTFMLCLNFLLVYFYARPYKGEMQVQPQLLIHMRNQLRKAPMMQKEEERKNAAADSSKTQSDNAGKSNTTGTDDTADDDASEASQ